MHKRKRRKRETTKERKVIYSGLKGSYEEFNPQSHIKQRKLHLMINKITVNTKEHTQ